jgi:hypothetical protein
VNCFCRNIQAFERRKFPMGYGVQNRTTPCRVTGAVVEVVPLIGGILGAAFRACGDTID